MTHKEMKKKVYGMIEELNPDSEYLTDDPDLSTKYNDVCNQVMFELARIKKIPRYIELEVRSGDILTFEDLEAECGNEIYQIAKVEGVNHLYKASGTVVKVTSDGLAEIDVYVYPERITDSTSDSYEFELSPDVLEIMPYGIAADLLKSDISAEYGNVYANRFKDMLNSLDPRYMMYSVYIEGGVNW